MLLSQAAARRCCACDVALVAVASVWPAHGVARACFWLRFACSRRKKKSRGRVSPRSTQRTACSRCLAATIDLENVGGRCISVDGGLGGYARALWLGARDGVDRCAESCAKAGWRGRISPHTQLQRGLMKPIRRLKRVDRRSCVPACALASLSRARRFSLLARALAQNSRAHTSLPTHTSPTESTEREHVEARNAHWHARADLGRHTRGRPRW